MSRRLEARLAPTVARARGADGFTLVETLVAFTVMAMLLSVLFRGVVTLRAGSTAFDDRTRETLVARAILEDALADRRLRGGTTSGRRDGLRWTVNAAAVDLSGQIPATPAEPPTPGQPPSNAKPKWAPQRLVVRVETAGRPVVVETIRLVAGE